MKQQSWILAGVLLLGLGGIADAQTPQANGSLVLTGEVDGSLGFFFWQDPDGFQLVEGGASTAIDIGPVSAYGTPNNVLLGNKFTKGMDADGFHVTTPFQIQVAQANLQSPGYTLMAHLGDNDDTVWEVDGVILSTTPELLASTEPYTLKRPHILYAKFPFTKSATSLNDVVTFMVTAN